MTPYDIALTLQPQIGPRTAAYLIETFESAEKIFHMPVDELVGRARLNPDIAKSLVKNQFLGRAEKEMRFCERNNITPIAATDDGYPQMLKECGDHPHVVYYRGDRAALTRQSVSMVGTRNITAYGQKMSDRLVGELAALRPDVVIVSGLAFGVDGACHRAALSSGLSTIGALANPLTAISPPAHALLAEEMIRRGGGVLSEYHSETPVNGKFFAPRNRVIAGMSAGTVIVESPFKGGSMITAGMADGYNRCLMALPGRAGDRCSEGTNHLIKTNKARMVCSGRDILSELDWDFTVPSAAAAGRDLSQLSKDAAGLYGCLPEADPVGIEDLGALTGLSAGELATVLLELEFEGLVRVLPGKRYEKE